MLAHAVKEPDKQSSASICFTGEKSNSFPLSFG